MLTDIAEQSPVTLWSVGNTESFSALFRGQSKSLEQLDDVNNHNILDYIKVDKFKKISGFEKRDVENFEKTMQRYFLKV